jgi:hypothetical protein
MAKKTTSPSKAKALKTYHDDVWGVHKNQSVWVLLRALQQNPKFVNVGKLQKATYSSKWTHHIGESPVPKLLVTCLKDKVLSTYVLDEDKYSDFSYPPFKQKNWTSNTSLTNLFEAKSQKKYNKGGWLREWVRTEVIDTDAEDHDSASNVSFDGGASPAPSSLPTVFGGPQSISSQRSTPSRSSESPDDQAFLAANFPEAVDVMQRTKETLHDASQMLLGSQIAG